MFTTITPEQIATVRWEAGVRSRFSYTVGDDVALTEIATAAINGESSVNFAALHIEAQETGYVTCGMVADALNEIVRLDTEGRMQADLDAALSRKEMRRRHQGRCNCCNRKLTDARSIAIGIGPECRAKTAPVRRELGLIVGE